MTTFFPPFPQMDAGHQLLPLLRVREDQALHLLDSSHATDRGGLRRHCQGILRAANPRHRQLHPALRSVDAAGLLRSPPLLRGQC